MHRALDPEGWDWTNSDDLAALMLRQMGVGVPVPGGRQHRQPRKQATRSEMRRFFSGAIDVVKDGDEG